MHPNEQRKEELRMLVEQEVKAQMTPFIDLMTKLHEWQLSFWSNGSGRPPGFFQSRIKSDDDRYAALLEFQKKQTAELTATSDYIKAEIVRKRDRQERWKRRWPLIQWLGGGLATALLALMAWLGPHILRVADILWQDYLKYHPAVSEQIKTAGGPQISSEQTAGGTQTPNH